MINSKCVYVKLTNIFSLILILESNFGQSYGFIWGLPRWLRGKESACQCRSHRRVRFHPLVGKIPWRGKQQTAPVFFFFFFFNLFIWLCQVLVAVCGIFNWDIQTVSCGMWNLVPWLGIKPWPSALGERSLNHRTTREVPAPGFLPGKPHRQRSLVGCSPWGCKESDVTEHTCTHGLVWHALQGQKLTKQWQADFHSAVMRGSELETRLWISCVWPFASKTVSQF